MEGTEKPAKDLKKKTGKITWILTICAAVYAALAFFLVGQHGVKAFWLLPLVPLALYLLIFKFEAFFFLIVFCTPLSVEFNVTDTNRLSVPVELMLIGFTVLFLLQMLITGTYDKKILRHPVSISLLFYFLVLLVTSFTSIMPEVSFKHFAAQIWFIVPAYFASAFLFKDKKKIDKYFWLYCSSLCIVALYALYGFYAVGFEFYEGYNIMEPFYKDHTIYGAVLTLFLPPAFMFFIDKKNNPQPWKRYLAGFVTALLILALVFSYCRAAWACLVFAIGFGIILRTKIKLRWVFFFAACFIGLFLAYQKDIILYLEQNKQNSSGKFTEQIKSITNISTDESNLERMNRWSCAIKMGAEKPLTGFGPGTYQFVYGSYQRSVDMTGASTRTGDLGNAHSEYLGPFSESGIFGSLAILCIFGFTFFTAVKVYRNAEDAKIRNYAFYLLIALITYYVHGILNNYLDTEKISIPFWGFTAAIVALDIYFPKKQTTKLSEKSSGNQDFAV